MTSCARGCTSATNTGRQAVEDWLANGLDGCSAKTMSTYSEVLDPLSALLGSAKLPDLTARQVPQLWRRRRRPCRDGAGATPNR
jgi:hypothetical protein